jgi:hypothetical protein
MIYVKDAFATMADIYSAIPERYLTSKAQMTYPRAPSASASISGPERAIGANSASPRQNNNDATDDTASFREEMGMQDPQGALTMDELLDHEGPVWVVLRQHNKVPKQLLAVFPCSINAQFYAKNHKGFQKKFASTTDMLEDGYTRGVMQPLKAAY